MAETSPEPITYQIGDLTLLPATRKLRRGSDEWSLSIQKCQILTLLAEHAPNAVSQDLLRERVWKGQQRSTNTIPQAIYELRTFLKDACGLAEQDLILTNEEDGGSGYYLSVSVASNQKTLDQGLIKKSEDDLSARPPVDPTSFNWKKASALRYFVSGLILGLGCALAAMLWWPPRNSPNKGRVAVYAPEEEEKIRHIVKESQLYITLQAYRDPNNIDKGKLQEYLVPDSAEAATVQKIIDRFTSQNIRYGDESKNEGFEVTSVTVFSPGDTAEATTIEGWYVPAYRNGQRDQDRKALLGPYRLTYQLRKMQDKKWRVEHSTTPVRKE